MASGDKTFSYLCQNLVHAVWTIKANKGGGTNFKVKVENREQSQQKKIELLYAELSH